MLLLELLHSSYKVSVSYKIHLFSTKKQFKAIF